MKVLNSILFVMLQGISCFVIAQVSSQQTIYKNQNYSIDERVDDLLSKMSLDEKIIQLNQFTLGRNTNANNIEEMVKVVPSGIGSLIYFNDNAELRNKMQQKAMEDSRLGIPILFGYDVIHGFRTIYPISIAQACSWNPNLVEKACGIAAQEARSSGIEWTFSPMVDVCRDGRWGRVSEGYGEDTYTNAVFAASSVKGYQGNDLTNQNNMAACLKHYVGYGASEGGRDYVYTEISRSTLWNTYLPPFEAGIKAGAVSVMSAFNDISGIPASSNKYTLTNILKEDWQHEGFVVSDWAAIKQLINQGVAKDEKEAAFKAFTAGVEMDMEDGLYQKHLSALVAEGRISERQINEAVKRILKVKFKLGLFEHPYTKIKPDSIRFLQPKALDIAEQLAQESMVLLKNNQNILPLTYSSKNIAIIGPMAKNKEHLLGAWCAHGNVSDVTSIYEGIESEFDDATLYYTLGCDFDDTVSSDFVNAIRIADKADVVIVCLGEKNTWSGENTSRASLALPAVQEQLLKGIKKTGKPVILLLTNGRPLGLANLEPYANAIIEMWQPGIQGGKAVAGILSGRINPSGKLAITFPYSNGQIPIYYCMRKSARPTMGKYQDIPNKPLYDFGYGLSYTSFEYGDINLIAQEYSVKDTIVVEVPVINSGASQGSETVHWFITDLYCSISRPKLELKYFEKKSIAPGDTAYFSFEIVPIRDLSFIDNTGKRIIEPGDFIINVKDKAVRITLTKD